MEPGISLAFLKDMAKFKVPTIILLQLGAMAFTGCYTQLYSRGYAERAAANYPDYYRAPAASGDTLAPTDSAGWARADSLRKADSLLSLEESGRTAGGSGNGSVIVNNYYQESPYYRGYLIQDWNYPTLAFGIYSSRYRDYYGPYWWNDPWYRSGGGYHRGYHGNHGNNGGYDTPAGGGSGPYTSDKRIFTPAPDHELRKGRRAEPVQQPAPKYGSDNASSGTGSNSGSSSSSSSGSSSSSSSGSSSGSGSSEKDDHPDVKKGKRR
jgi:hypothetical protein